MGMNMKTHTYISLCSFTFHFQAVPVFYRQARPEYPQADILLLHGGSFSSKTWVDPPMQTLQILYRLGYNAVAVDLPGAHSRCDEPPRGKTNNVVSEQVRHKPGCTSTEKS